MAATATTDNVQTPSRFDALREKRQEKLQKIRSASQYFEKNDTTGVDDHDPNYSNRQKLLEERPIAPVAAEEFVEDTADVGDEGPEPRRLINRRSNRSNSVLISNREASNSCLMFLSVLYALVLIVLGTAFPLAEIISAQVPPLFYQKFYLYLYGVSLAFLFFAYLFLLESTSQQTRACFQWIRRSLARTTTKRNSVVKPAETTEEPADAPNYTAKTGSFFLRMGAILFGVGSMLYSCLEFGQFFELQDTSDACGSIMAVVTPGFRFLFCFVQLYFIFTNSRIRSDRYTNISRFGLMHMLATNICVWLSVLMEETKHELQSSTFNPEMPPPHGFHSDLFAETFHHPHKNETPKNESTFLEHGFQSGRRLFHADRSSTIHLPNSTVMSCRSRTTVGNVLQQASPFLYPCIVEHSLICAALTYVMWSGLNIPWNGIGSPFPVSRRKRQQYTVDCHGATRGLFVGLLMSLMTIISMILFFVWIYIWQEDYYSLSVFQAYIVETILYSATLLAVGVAFFRIRRLKFENQEGSKLDDILLIISQMGVFVFPTFILISGHHTIFANPTREDICGLVSTLLETVQSTAQTLFLLDATRRRPTKDRHVEEKPGREFVMFLLVCNFNLWAIDSLEAWRQQLYPQQLRFYGTWTWTLITHISMPLTIFYRFHSSVCFSEVWKSAYKYKSPVMSDATV